MREDYLNPDGTFPSAKEIEQAGYVSISRMAGPIDGRSLAELFDEVIETSPLKFIVNSSDVIIHLIQTKRGKHLGFGAELYIPKKNPNKK